LFFSTIAAVYPNHWNNKMKADGKKKALFDNDKSSASSSSDDSSSSSSSEEVEKLTVNKKFAKAYESRKQKEELKQMQDRGEMRDSDDSSSEEEDEDAQLITPSVNLQFIKTIKALRNKDSSIYDPQTQFFEDDGKEDNNEKSEKKRKPKKFKDVIREQILEQMDDEDAEKGSKDNNGEDAKPSKFAYDEQQEDLRKAFLKESKMASDSESDDDNDWMIVKKKGGAKVDDPETEKKVSEELKSLEESFKGRKEKEFKDPRGEVKDGDQFLLDYIKNKKWIDNSHQVDDYSEDEDKAGDDSDASLGEMDKADDFESNYNFRFEQAAAETATSGAAFSVQSYARAQTMNTLRRKDETRRDKRIARLERKAAERKAKEEQLKRLKNAKKAEMNKKLSKVKSVLGEVGDDAVDEVAIMKMLEGDYDPEKFEEAMKAAYGDDFYQKDDTQWKSDKDVVETLKNDEDVVDVVGQDDLDGGLYDNYDEGEGDENNGEDEEYPDEEMEVDEDDDIIGGEQDEETDLHKKIKSKMQEELYKLDYEDVVAGMPTRFKYRQVEKNDYGLSTEEILLARDTTLKQFVSLNKMAPYNESGEYFTDSKKRRRFREALRAEIEEMEKKDEPVDEAEPAEVDDTAEDAEPKKKKRRRIKKGKKNKEKENELDNPDTEDKDQENAPESEKVGDEAANEEDNKKRRKKKGKKGQSLDPVETAEKDSKEEDEKTTAKIAESTNPIENDAKAEEEKTTEQTAESTKAGEKKKKRKKKINALAGLSASRLGAYGL
jgi:protein KRI1